jgi:hypothetical protein
LGQHEEGGDIDKGGKLRQGGRGRDWVEEHEVGEKGQRQHDEEAPSRFRRGGQSQAQQRKGSFRATVKPRLAASRAWIWADDSEKYSRLSGHEAKPAGSRRL